MVDFLNLKEEIASYCHKFVSVLDIFFFFLEKISHIYSFKTKFLVFYACKLLPATCIFFVQ